MKRANNTGHDGPHTCHPGLDPGSREDEVHAPTGSSEAADMGLSAKQKDDQASDETSYLLKTPANANRLHTAIAELNAGFGVERQLPKETT